MSLRKGSALRPFADNIMKALSGTILDPSPSIRKSYAVAIGYVAHLSTDNTLIKLMGHLKKVYCDNSGNYYFTIAMMIMITTTAIIIAIINFNRTRDPVNCGNNSIRNIQACIR